MPGQRAHWLERYGKNHLAWQAGEEYRYYFRAMGLVERSFDIDGVHFEGRADISTLLELEVASRLSEGQLRERILLAWTALRLNHTMIMAKLVDHHSDILGVESTRSLRVDQPRSPEEAIATAKEHIVYVQDAYPAIDHDDFYLHTFNTARVIDAERSVTKLFVLPPTKKTGSTQTLRFVAIIAHLVADGLTTFTWFNDFIRLLNLPLKELRATIEASWTPTALQRKLLPPQENLYPSISGNIARQRWYWAITRVLRHNLKPNPQGYPNPTYRRTPRQDSVAFPQKYPLLLDYSRRPPLNSAPVTVMTSKKGAQRLAKLCKQAGSSVGAGCFALMTIILSEMREEQSKEDPSIDLRLPFLSGFPINPRPFFGQHGAPDSMMLAFCDYFWLPFLPSSIPFEKRFNFLVKRAQRQLEVYQKRVRPDSVVPSDSEERAQAIKQMGARGPGRLLAVSYLTAVDRLITRLAALPDPPPPEFAFPPQGEYPVRPSPSLATCGVSSIGRSLWNQHVYGVAQGVQLREGEDAFAADFRDLRQNVRAREGELLAGVGSDSEGRIISNASADMNANDEERLERFKAKFASILDENESRL